MQHLILCGFKAVGKTTLGRQFSKKYGYQFIDIDIQLCHMLGWDGDIRELYMHLGAAAFRVEESKMIKNMIFNERTVIATGGGAVIDPDNVRYFRRMGKIVYLEASPDFLYARMQRLEKVPAFITATDQQAAFQAYYQSRVHYYPTIADAQIDMLGPDPLHQLQVIAKEFYGQ